MKKFLSVIILFVLSNFAFSCDCGWGGPFLKMAHDGDAILKGKVKQHSVLSADDFAIAMEFQVIGNYKGEAGARVTVWGDFGAHCRPLIRRFPEGSEWVLILDKIEGPADGDNFVIRDCGQFWVPVEDGIAFGPIFEQSERESEDEVALEDLKEMILQLKPH